MLYVLLVDRQVEIVRPEEEHVGFGPLPKQWVIEHTFSWFGADRRLNRCYEYHPETSEAMVRAAKARLMVRRIT